MTELHDDTRDGILTTAMGIKQTPNRRSGGMRQLDLDLECTMQPSLMEILESLITRDAINHVGYIDLAASAPELFFRAAEAFQRFLTMHPELHAQVAERMLWNLICKVGAEQFPAKDSKGPLVITEMAYLLRRFADQMICSNILAEVIQNMRGDHASVRCTVQSAISGTKEGSSIVLNCGTGETEFPAHDDGKSGRIVELKKTLAHQFSPEIFDVVEMFGDHILVFRKDDSERGHPVRSYIINSDGSGFCFQGYSAPEFQFRETAIPDYDK